MLRTIVQSRSRNGRLQLREFSSAADSSGRSLATKFNKMVSALDDDSSKFYKLTSIDTHLACKKSFIVINRYTHVQFTSSITLTAELAHADRTNDTYVYRVCVNVIHLHHLADMIILYRSRLTFPRDQNLRCRLRNVYVKDAWPLLRSIMKSTEHDPDILTLIFETSRLSDLQPIRSMHFFLTYGTHKDDNDEKTPSRNKGSVPYSRRRFAGR